MHDEVPAASACCQSRRHGGGTCSRAPHAYLQACMRGLCYHRACICLCRPSFARVLEELHDLRAAIPEPTPPLEPIMVGLVQEDLSTPVSVAANLPEASSSLEPLPPPDPPSPASKGTAASKQVRGHLSVWVWVWNCGCAGVRGCSYALSRHCC